jgi:hypothetical protein
VEHSTDTAFEFEFKFEFSSKLQCETRTGPGLRHMALRDRSFRELSHSHSYMVQFSIRDQSFPIRYWEWRGWGVVALGCGGAWWGEGGGKTGKARHAKRTNTPHHTHYIKEL